MNIRKFRQLVKLSDSIWEDCIKCEDDSKKLRLRFGLAASRIKVASGLLHMLNGILRGGTLEQLTPRDRALMLSASRLSNAALQSVAPLVAHMYKGVEDLVQLKRLQAEVNLLTKQPEAYLIRRMSQKTVDTFIDKITELIQAGKTEDAIGLAEELRQFIHNH